MILLVVLRTLAIALFLYFAFTQIIIPMFRGTPLLPILERETAIRRDIRSAKQEVVDLKLEQQLEHTKQKAEQLKPAPTEEKGRVHDS